MESNNEFRELQFDELTEIEGGGWLDALTKALSNTLIWSTAMYTYNHFYTPINPEDIK